MVYCFYANYSLQEYKIKSAPQCWQEALTEELFLPKNNTDFSWKETWNNGGSKFAVFCCQLAA